MNIQELAERKVALQNTLMAIGVPLPELPND